MPTNIVKKRNSSKKNVSKKNSSKKSKKNSNKKSKKTNYKKNTQKMNGGSNNIMFDYHIKPISPNSIKYVKAHEKKILSTGQKILSPENHKKLYKQATNNSQIHLLQKQKEALNHIKRSIYNSSHPEVQKQLLNPNTGILAKYPQNSNTLVLSQPTINYLLKQQRKNITNRYKKLKEELIRLKSQAYENSLGYGFPVNNNNPPPVNNNNPPPYRIVDPHPRNNPPPYRNYDRELYRFNSNTYYSR